MIRRFKVTKRWSWIRNRYIVKVKLETENKTEAESYYDIAIEGITMIMDRPKNLTYKGEN